MVRKNIVSLLDASGRRTTDRGEIAALTVEYYRNLLGKESLGYQDRTDRLFDIVDFTWSTECCADLCWLITSTKVCEVLFSMNNGKALRPDGFSVGFFKAA